MRHREYWEVGVTARLITTADSRAPLSYFLWPHYTQVLQPEPSPCSPAISDPLSCDGTIPLTGYLSWNLETMEQHSQEFIKVPPGASHLDPKPG